MLLWAYGTALAAEVAMAPEPAIVHPDSTANKVFMTSAPTGRVGLVAVQTTPTVSRTLSGVGIKALISVGSQIRVTLFQVRTWSSEVPTSFTMQPSSQETNG